MTTTAKSLIASGYVPNAETTAYTAPVRCILDKYTAYNGDTVARSITVRIVPSGGSAGASNALVVKTLQPGETYTFPELVGHVLAAGDYISEIAAAASVIVRRASGREVS